MKSVKISPLAGKPPPAAMLVDVPRLVAACYADTPDPPVPAQLVAFGTSGHRGSALERTFNECHVLAISHTICEHCARQGTDGPIFVGIESGPTYPQRGGDALQPATATRRPAVAMLISRFRITSLPPLRIASRRPGPPQPPGRHEWD